MSNLSTYMDFYNNTPYTLKLKSTTAVHGSWKVSPPPAITPSQKDASFSMQDPSMAAAGSEGTVTYHVVVPSTNEEGDNSTTDVTFLARFCDSYSVGNNYCYFSTSHPELFAIYFEAEIDNHGWNKNYCPDSGHPLHLKFFVHPVL
ncbi:hypothetical protein [bacterium endosymbiont of Bathymodiolus sp. 5 South]|uniref:hypothetical protein n=1 Tax=bacterium endosymbiont of Bathymodiolus sp. 5 South TaxID=1181670 RepID=UPI0010B0AD4B|nr:hypothetical protein [bacterium endosymbiont of Bathymodiolus sp. 5 South]CAC9651466.1 hypothetical protein [uncultured Gammaproteobacteria bacterium]SHN92807.1 hypothetical protein BCLUESOX_2781 [bacterium endosymbiont of Bathymodiolus sp. 5 South]VVH58925.1 hypothetical protein BSPCLSOX_691 [uncultured Gammaproteobacteria bacterium]VVH63298.1 hypothetical protein BSPWISOX_2046 [uncultured Gammaproteobacteria bacterium]VVM22623.1 hypothetical protein BSPWISOXPB_9826 [uncultured Gammaproteo